MLLDLSQFTLRAGLLSQRPFEILREADKKYVSALMEILLLEGAEREVRDAWQLVQLGNLCKHAQARSAFWKSRLALLAMDPRQISRLPAFTRKELIAQVTKEGALIRPADGLKLHEHSTSGSSGIPVRFYISDANRNYNVVRYQLEGLLDRRAHLNRARFRPEFTLPAPGFAIELMSNEETAKRSLFGEPEVFRIKYGHFEPGAFLQALNKLDLQVWISNPGLMEAILSVVDASDLHRAGLRHWTVMSGRIPDHVRDEVKAAGIEISSSYSSEEIGPIGFECKKHPGHYHVVSSNVVVHPSGEEFIQDGISCNRILVTHLHSYATPFIKYDLGDFGRISDSCPCGFDGQVITRLFGRVSSALVHADGRRTAFLIQNRKIKEIGGVREFRARQIAFTRVIVDVVPEGDGSEIRERLNSYLCAVAGPGIDVELNFCESIDWGQSAKRPSFRSEIA
jgi:phenylacetate-coenzyme A ligase PaaK-like adenylate-forming protein